MSKKYNFKKNANGETVLHNQGRRKFNVIAPICCLLLAVCIWLYVAGSDLGDTAVYTVALKYRGVETTEAKWGAEPWAPSEVRVKVTLNGPEKFLKKIDADQIEAYVDVSGIEAPGSVSLPVKVDLEDVSPTVEVQSVSVSDTTVLVDMEGVKTVPVKVNLPASQNVVGVAEPAILELAGPVSVLDQIDFALVSLYGDLSAGQTFLRQTYIFFDSYGAIVNDPFLNCLHANANSVNVRLEDAAGHGEGAK